MKTTNKTATDIVKYFFQANNEFKKANTDSSQYLINDLKEKGLKVDFVTDTTDFSDDQAQFIVKDTILVFVVDEVGMEKHMDDRLLEKFSEFGVDIILVLKFGKHAQVKRKSISNTCLNLKFNDEIPKKC